MYSEASLLAFAESVPNKDLTTPNLKYFTVNQALDDVMYFMSQFTYNSKAGPFQWFVFGGSYSGALSAWFRIKVRAG